MNLISRRKLSNIDYFPCGQSSLEQQLTIESTRKAFNIAEKRIFLEAFEKQVVYNEKTICIFCLLAPSVRCGETL